MKENYGLEVREEFLKISENELDNVALIQHILNVKECICGDKIDTKKESHLVNLLEHLDNKPRYSSTIIYKAKKVVEYIDTVSEGDFDSFTDLYNSYKSKVDKLNQYVIDRNNLLNQIPNDIDTDSVMNKSNNNIKSLGHLEALIEKEKEGYEKNENRISGLNEDLEKKKQEKEEKEEEIAMVNNQHDNYLFFKNTREKLQRLRNDYINEAQNNISERANEYFMELLSDDDKAAFNYLKINSNYKIEAYNNDGKEIFSQFSAGQKHLAAMAFTMGLTAVASNAKPTCNFPLVMDTPMSNLDLGNRERLIKLMPKVVSQWILTPMDTELTDKEIDFFEKTNKVGKVYRLNKQNELSYIEEFDDISKIKGELLNV